MPDADRGFLVTAAAAESLVLRAGVGVFGTGGFSTLISATTTSAGLKVYAHLGDSAYPDKIKIPDNEIQPMNLLGDPFHRGWN